GRGTAQTDTAIVAEYHQFLDTLGHIATPEVRQYLRSAPIVMERRIGKPLLAWTDEEILALYHNRHKATGYYYSAFLAFLLFPGSRRASVAFLMALPCDLSRMHRPALQPYRAKLETMQAELSYAGRRPQVGSELTLLIFLLAVVAKPLAELTRADFDA